MLFFYPGLSCLWKIGQEKELKWRIKLLRLWRSFFWSAWARSMPDCWAAPHVIQTRLRVEILQQSACCSPGTSGWKGCSVPILSVSPRSSIFKGRSRPCSYWHSGCSASQLGGWESSDPFYLFSLKNVGRHDNSNIWHIMKAGSYSFQGIKTPPPPKAQFLHFYCVLLRAWPKQAVHREHCISLHIALPICSYMLFCNRIVNSADILK